MDFFTDTYDFFCISLLAKLIGRVYYTIDDSPNPGTLTPSCRSTRTSAPGARSSPPCSRCRGSASWFFCMTAFMLGLVVPYEHRKSADNHIWFVVMHGFTLFFTNFRPNGNTFIVVAEIYPARLRATCHGISTASGKVGAIIRPFGFLYLTLSPDPAETTHGYLSGIWVQNSLFALDACSFAGFLLTFLVLEPKGKTLEEMSGETEHAQP
jgi:MFS transporter, PHS family, inorganic phosphate transporter